jgi:hypothetical protein
LTAATARLARMTAIWQRAAPVLTSSAFVGVLVAVAAWNVPLAAPSVGVDTSWPAGLYMATHAGFHFGTEVIWTYGPLGFLVQPSVIFRTLGVIAFLYQSALLVALCASLVWAVRRTFNLAVALLIVYVTVALGFKLEITLALAAIWCLAALAPSPPSYARHVVALGGGALGAIGCLVKLSLGPAILLMCGATLVALPTRWRDLARLAGSALATFTALWFATGQSLGNLPDYVSSAREVIVGYSQAMGLDAEPDWYIFAALEILVMLVAWSAVAAAPGKRRAAAGVVMALAAFAAFKEGVVRFDADHIAIYFATATALTLAIPWRRALAPAAIVTFALTGGLYLGVTSTSLGDALNPIHQVDGLRSEVRTVADSGRWSQAQAGVRASLQASYALDPATLGDLRGHTVDIWPWEDLAAWAYRLEWRPEPVFQSYQAYTSALDRDNATALASPEGPDRILRSAPAVSSINADVDGRNLAWDPPLATVAMLCHYAPLHTTARWQVLARVADRCGQLHPLRSVSATNGQTVKVPKSPPGTAVIAKVHGAGVSGIEALRTFFLRSNVRYAVINGTTPYRLVPGTAADGLLMSVPKRADFPGRNFNLSPDASLLSFAGTSGDLRIDFYALPIRSLPRAAR